MQSNKSNFRDSFSTSLCTAIFLLTALFLLPTIKAQTAGEGTISGTVTDSTGAAVPDATVTATMSLPIGPRSASPHRQAPTPSLRCHPERIRSELKQRDSRR